ncbi:MAG: ABC transporter ATP-binding protein [Candidatus Bathyarchaeota archaeon]|nr:MAG: ABC transporter ATP-binding protein [Candidatus Bathyarchaeota archaeon]
MDHKVLLQVKNLNVSTIENEEAVKIIDGVDLRIREGETVGLIGPTAAGKTITAMAILELLDPFGVEELYWRVEGETLFKGRDLRRLPRGELDKIRGKDISMIPQKPIRSLNPLYTVGFQTGEPLEVHEKLERQIIERMVIEYLGKVELPDAKTRRHFFRHQFSGGEAQRIMIAMALICNPSLLLADEPTSDLDVTIQRQVLELLKRMKAEFGLSMLMITHDLGVIAEMSDYVYVMYAGRIIEHGDVTTIFKKTRHPYTRGLLSSVPRIDGDDIKLKGIPGNLPPPPYDFPRCSFYPRCEHRDERCGSEIPGLRQIRPDHYVACHKAENLQAG